MALGGGTFTTQNKVLSGAYINFVSASRASATLSDRGICALPLAMNWGAEGVIEVDNGILTTQAMEVFGYSYESNELLYIREVLRHAKTLYLYRLNGGTKATSTFGTAKCSGTRGNDIKLVIAVNADAPSKYDVKTFVGTIEYETQTVASASDLVDNAFVVFNKEAVLEAKDAVPFTNGTNGTVTGANHSAFLSAIEPYSFNTLGCASNESTINSLYVAFTKRMRDEVGAKFQTVLYNTDADYEGVINVVNDVNAVYWVVGAECGCEINKSLLNKKYDGELTIQTAYTQKQLETFLKNGSFAFHKVGNDIRVLGDINSLVSFTETKNSDFGDNQTMRVLDQIANDIATLFNTKYLGNIPNDASGRVSLWNDIVTHHKELETLRAIENFNSDDVKVEKGNTKKAVVVTDKVTPVNCMAQLYMTVEVA